MTKNCRSGFTKEGGYEEPLYFQTPRCLVKEGIIKGLTEGALKTLMVFYYLTFYYKTDRVKVTIDVLMEHTGLSKKTQCSAVKILAEGGHVFVARGSKGTPNTYRMNIASGSASYVAFVEHRKPQRSKPEASPFIPIPQPQDVGVGVKSTPAPDRCKIYTSTGEEFTPPIIDTTKGDPKGSEEPTTTTDPCSGSGPKDSTDVEEGGVESEKALEGLQSREAVRDYLDHAGIYRPRHFTLQSREAVRDYLDHAGGLVEVLNVSLETLDRDKGRGKNIHSQHCYLLEIIKRKRQEVAHLGPAPEPETPAAGVDREPEKSPEEREVSRKLGAWIMEFREAHPDWLPSPETLDCVRAYIRQHGSPPDPDDLMTHLPPDPFIKGRAVV